MKILAKKGSSAQRLLEYMTALLEQNALEYPVLAENVEIDLPLQNKAGVPCPGNGETCCFEEQQNTVAARETAAADAYNYDALTGLYNRSRYERDLAAFKAAGYAHIVCVYMDAVGLHEINNHLGHQAGDAMLQCVADGIREIFPDGHAYRIGGDEYVVLCFDCTLTETEEAAFQLRKWVSEQEYEISVGIAEGRDPAELSETINEAEHAMRRHKAEFYRQNGAERQMRTLNHKLEKLLLEKRDASQFLNVIAPRYKGVYMVNPKDDSCRYIYIPKYFQKTLEENGGSFSPSIRTYCQEFVRPEYRESFRTLIDYDRVRADLDAGKAIDYIYQKVDGGWIRLKITIYDRNAPDSGEMQWIFMDATPQN